MKLLEYIKRGYMIPDFFFFFLKVNTALTPL